MSAPIFMMTVVYLTFYYFFLFGHDMLRIVE